MVRRRGSLGLAAALACALVPAGAGAAVDIGPRVSSTPRLEVTGSSAQLTVSQGRSPDNGARRAAYATYSQYGRGVSLKFRTFNGPLRARGDQCRSAERADIVLPARITAAADSDNGSGLLSVYVCPDNGDGTRFVLQPVAKKRRDFGGAISGEDVSWYLSLYSPTPPWESEANVEQQGIQPATAFDLAPVGPATYDGAANLLGYGRWSKFSPGGYKGYLRGEHFPVLFGSFSIGGIGVYGPGDRFGAPTTTFGRNVYIDTLDSDYGPGWRRVMGVLTQPTRGTWCYEFSPKGGSAGMTGVSSSNRYRITAIGPGLTPVVREEVRGPDFPFGAPDYDPKTMKWGTGFSAEQAKALRDQAAMIGPAFRTKPQGKGSTDCGATLRQLPESFFAPPPA